MKQARAGHGVFIQLDAFVVVGGVSEDSYGVTDFTTERCTLIDGAIDCTVVDPIFSMNPNGKHPDYPEMIRVPYDYCPKQNL